MLCPPAPPPINQNPIISKFSSIMPSSHHRRSQISSLICEIAADIDIDIADDDNSGGSKFSPPSARSRLRRSVAEVYRNIGPTYFRRAFRMTYESFCRLHMKIKFGIQAAARRLQKYINRRIMCLLPFLMDQSVHLFVWHAHCVILWGGLHVT